MFRALHERFGSGGWLAFLSTLTVIGGGWGGLAVVPLLVRERTRRSGTALTVALVVAATIVFLLKMLVRRKRPYLAVAGVRALVFEAPTDFSFPSGHAAGSFAFATFVACLLLRSPITGGGWWRWGAAFALVALAAGVGLSRVALGVHYPGDVLAGATLGSVVGISGAWWHLRLPR